MIFKMKLSETEHAENKKECVTSEIFIFIVCTKKILSSHIFFLLWHSHCLCYFIIAVVIFLRKVCNIPRSLFLPKHLPSIISCLSARFSMKFAAIVWELSLSTKQEVSTTTYVSGGNFFFKWEIFLVSKRSQDTLDLLKTLYVWKKINV